MSEWTKGPWTLIYRDGDPDDVLEEIAPKSVGGTIIGPGVAPGTSDAWLDVSHANARLIAAAPDMAEALERVLREAKIARGYDPNDSALDDAMSLGYAALRRARGEGDDRAV